MAALFNLARVTTATTGTGTITLGAAVSGFLTFALAGVTNGTVVSYGIYDGANREVGTGTYTSSGTTLTRSVVKSTNSDAAINLSGTAEVFITPLASDFAYTYAQISASAGAIALSNLADPTTGKVIGSSGSAAAAVYPPGYVYSYQQITSQQTTTATSEGTAGTIITADAIVFDGSTVVDVDVFCQSVTNSGSNDTALVLYDGASSIGVWATVGGATALAGGPVSLSRRLTPSAASHTYSLRMYVVAGTGGVSAGAGGSGAGMPSFIRVRKA